MNHRALAITIIAIVATAASVVIGARAIVGTAGTLRHSTGTSEASPGSLEQTGSEVEGLLEDLAEARTFEEQEVAERDPMVPYKAPKPKSTPKKPAAPPKPTYKVMAVFIDDDSTALLAVSGKTVRVRVGDEVSGGRVIAIEEDGVTIEGEGGSRKYSPAPSK